MKKRRNKGFTLVEALVAFAVLGIAVLGIGGFFVSAARSYSSVSDETSLQYEAQLALNQMENMLIDSTLGVSYNYVTTAAEDKTGFHFVTADSQMNSGVNVVSKVLYAFNVNETNSNKLDVLLLKWVAKDESIYYKELEITDRTLKTEDIDIAGTTAAGWDLLAEDVDEFSVDLSGYAATKKVNLNLGFENRSKDYGTSGTVVLRNDVTINAETVEAIYDRISKETKAIIDGVEISANTNVTVPGGALLLTTTVTSDAGFPAQDISQWLIATDDLFTNIVYDSLDNNYNSATTYIQETDQKNKHILNVGAYEAGNGALFNEVLKIKAIVNTTKADGSPVSYEDVIEIGVKLISNIEVSVSADTTLAGNSNLTGQTFYSATLLQQRADATNIPEMTLHPNNTVQMNGRVTASDSTTDSEKELRWDIHSKTDGVVATIDNKGKLSINQYSKVGSFVVRASLKLDGTVYVEYKVKVGTQYNKDNATLAITTDKNVINRGGSLACSLTLNGNAVNNIDYDWVLSVISSNGQEITDTSVLVNSEGGVFANYDLSYDYSYDVWITASLKSNPEISASTKISIPKVSLTISPLSKYSTMGAKVTGITCTAVGLEEYDIRWSMAKDLNPKYFFTAWGNFNITGSKNSDGQGVATVVMGDATLDPQTNVTVKAYLKDNANYNATMKIYTGSVSLNIKGNTTVNRGNSVDLDVELTSSMNTGITVTKDTVKWEITEVKANGTPYPSLIDENISISKGKLTVGSGFAANYSNTDVTVTVKASDDAYGLEDTHNVTVKSVKVGVYPEKILIPDGSAATTIQYTSYSGASWSVSKQGSSNNRPGMGGGGTTSSPLSINSSGKLTVNANNASTSDNATYTVTLTTGSGYNRKTYYGYVRYGFESDPSCNNSYTIKTEEKKDGSKTYEYVYGFKVGKSEYYVLRDGVSYPVYYVKYAVQRRRKYNYGSSGSYSTVESKLYAFVSSTTTVDGTGQWYECVEGNSNDQWKTISSAPSDWSNTYFR